MILISNVDFQFSFHIYVDNDQTANYGIFLFNYNLIVDLSVSQIKILFELTEAARFYRIGAVSGLIV